MIPYAPFRIWRSTLQATKQDLCINDDGMPLRTRAVQSGYARKLEAVTIKTNGLFQEILRTNISFQFRSTRTRKTL